MYRPRPAVSVAAVEQGGEPLGVDGEGKRGDRDPLYREVLRYRHVHDLGSELDEASGCLRYGLAHLRDHRRLVAEGFHEQADAPATQLVRPLADPREVDRRSDPVARIGLVWTRDHLHTGRHVGDVPRERSHMIDRRVAAEDPGVRDQAVGWLEPENAAPGGRETTSPRLMRS